MCDGCHVLKVSLVVTLEEVQRMLEDSNYERRVIALVEVLGKLGQRGGRAAVDAVLPQLDDSNENIQMFAAETLGKVASPGDRDRDVVEKLTMLLDLLLRRQTMELLVCHVFMVRASHSFLPFYVNLHHCALICVEFFYSLDLISPLSLNFHHPTSHSR